MEKKKEEELAVIWVLDNLRFGFLVWERDREQCGMAGFGF